LPRSTLARPFHRPLSLVWLPPAQPTPHPPPPMSLARFPPALVSPPLPCAFPFPLRQVIRGGGVMKQLALPILCELAAASPRTRDLLSAHDGVSFYIDLLRESYWQMHAISAIHYWCDGRAAPGAGDPLLRLSVRLALCAVPWAQLVHCVCVTWYGFCVFVCVTLWVCDTVGV
jgi:hypothetical protein